MVITTTDQYPQSIPTQLVQDKCNILDKFNIGDEIKAHYNLRGRKWVSPQGEVKYFASIEVWKLEGSAIKSPSEQYHDKNKSVQNEVANFTKPEGGDLPF